MTLFRSVAMVVVACLLTSSVAIAVPPPAAPIAPPSPATEVVPPAVQQRAAYGQLPLAFEENRGQTHPTVRFLARGAGYTAFPTATETVLVWRQLASRPTLSGATGRSSGGAAIWSRRRPPTRKGPRSCACLWPAPIRPRGWPDSARSPVSRTTSSAVIRPAGGPTCRRTPAWGSTTSTRVSGWCTRQRA